MSSLNSKYATRVSSMERRPFLNLIDKEYHSTGAQGFLRLNGLFSKHIDDKYGIDSDLYHSMNMVSQKHTILNRLRKSIAEVIPKKRKTIVAQSSPNKSMSDGIQNSTIDNAEKNTMDNTSKNSDFNDTTLMYGRCSKLEKWKNFQEKRGLSNNKSRYMHSKSTLPVLKYHKDKIFKMSNMKNTLAHRKSPNRIKQL